MYSENQSTIKANDYHRTYINNKNVTSLHAEHSAICTFCKLNKKPYLEANNILFVVRYNKNGIMCDSKPCNHCAFLILTYGVKKCYL